MSRPQMTLIDYVIVAITPALIMVLIGSLVHFLMAVFYSGGFGGRINYVMSLFVFASVLIARIAIEEGRERSILFAIPLAAATLFVSGRFVQFQGPLASFSFVINGGLIVLIMWCADRLTWDCTVIDEREDVSGEGLLQTVGLDPSTSDQKTCDAAKAAPQSNPQATADLPEATSSRDAPPQPKTWWGRFVEHRNRPHAPGVWVVYFSLAALPLFGIGQRFIPESDGDARRYTFRLLCYYVGSALGLLMTSSFLSIRRYLRHRRLEMPAEMTGVWLTTGTVMIVGLLFACALLPRPSAEYSVPDTLFGVSSPADLHASRYGAGSEGAQDPETKATRSATSEQAAENTKAGPSKNENGSGQGAESAGGKGAGHKESGGQGDGGRSGQAAQGAEGGGESKQNGSQGGRQDAKPSQRGSQDDNSETQNSQNRSGAESTDRGGDDERSSEAGESSNGDRQDPGDEQPSPSSSSDSKPAERRSGGQSGGSESAGSSPPPASSFDPGQWVGGLFSGLSSLFKGLYYLFFIVLVGYLLWRYREQVARAVSDFIQAIRDFWANLFGGSLAETEAENEAAVAAAAPPRPFSDYADPFLSDAAARYTPQELLAYSFLALQAWGREHGCVHDSEQTPHEYAGQLGLHSATVGREARRLAELYSFEAYSGNNLPRDQVDVLRNLWHVLRSEQAADQAAPSIATG